MSDTALNVAEVLREERRALARPEPPGNPGGAGTASATSADKKTNGSEPDNGLKPYDIGELYGRLNSDNHWALCLSGGGIRSAAFALGVIQRLAAQQVAPKVETDKPGSALQQFEYLSTVSGGGYIGSWLSAWLYQERKKRGEAGGGADKVVADLNRRIANDAEVPPITNLRRDSHYLAPSFSAISPDLWSDIAAFSRNLCLNWILFVPPMILAVLVTKALAFSFIDALYIHKGSIGFWSVMIGTTIGFLVALSFSVANRPGLELINASQVRFLICDMTLFLLSAAVLVFVLASHLGPITLSNVVDGSGLSWLNGDASNAAALTRGAALGLATYWVSWFAAPIWKSIPGQTPHHKSKPVIWYRSVDFVGWGVAGAVFGALIAAGYLVAAKSHFTDPVPDIPYETKIVALVCTVGLPWVVTARIIADVVFIAFAKFIPGSDAGLEYQARSGGILTLAQFGWFVWFGLVLGSPIAEQWFHHVAAHWIAAAGSVASGVFALFAGFYSKSGDLAHKAARIRRYLSLNALAAVAAAIFAATLVGWLSILMNWFLDLFKDNDTVHASWTLVLTMSTVLGAVIVAASLIIGINQYSLHGIYRNRLVRGFLGASRDEKMRDASKNRFTDFDSLDSPPLHELWLDDVNPRGDDWRPLHIINAALNLVSSKNLAWQERMAAPFTFSPLHCGSGSSIFTNGAYRRTFPPPDQGRPYGGANGVTLGTAMAISGAALSPNMGYNTSPGVAFLMALFNIRLGWWLANPRNENGHYWLNSPPVALWPYLMEMFGLTSEKGRWLYLSDGGHFENLGIYEMVRRRCRIIVVSDAGCDPDYTFDDLGNALRKIWIDLGVRIEMCGLDQLKKRFTERPTPAPQTPYWAVGRIEYEDADGKGDDGWLLYLKAGLHGTEPMDVLSYAMSHPSFPHETTANQFFSESQFESYRALGFEIVSRAFESAGRYTAPDAATAGASAETAHAGATRLTLDAVIKRLGIQLKGTA